MLAHNTPRHVEDVPNRWSVRTCPLMRQYATRHAAKFPLLGLVSATITIQRAIRMKNIVGRQQKQQMQTSDLSDSADPVKMRQVRTAFIAKFVLDFESTEKIPVTHLTREERSQRFSFFCALTIQRAFRLARARLYRSLQVQPVYRIAARQIYRSILTLSDSGQMRRIKRAALTIQNRARGMGYRRIFLQLKAYIEEVSGQIEASPVQLLRHINPLEANNLEAMAVDFVIRFRLGAPSEAPWPPRLYWKVFLKNQHICDVAVTAPRNYLLEQETGKVDKRLWYHRITNHPWRMLDLTAVDGIVKSSAAVMRPAFHSRDEIERIKKAKRIAWMREMRKLAVLKEMGLGDLEQLASSTLQQSVVHANACSVLLDDTPSDLGTSTETARSNLNTSEENLDDLLRWSETLDYDKYSNDWIASGVTISQREIVGSVLTAMSQEPLILGIPGHELGGCLRYSAEVLKACIQRTSANTVTKLSSRASTPISYPKT